jgi:hypothetical protein
MTTKIVVTNTATNVTNITVMNFGLLLFSDIFISSMILVKLYYNIYYLIICTLKIVLK